MSWLAAANRRRKPGLKRAESRGGVRVRTVGVAGVVAGFMADLLVY
jgi:hypothetical protein